MKKYTYIIILFITVLLSCNKIPLELNVTTTTPFSIYEKDIIQNDSIITFSINAKSKKIISKFIITIINDYEIITILDSTINSDYFETEYNYKIPDSLICLCKNNVLSFRFEAIQDDYFSITKPYSFMIKNTNHLKEDNFTLYALNNETNNKGFLSLEKSNVYTPEEAINYASYIDFGFSEDYFGDYDIDIPREYTENWDTTKSTRFSSKYDFNLSLEEYLNIENSDFLIEFDYSNFYLWSQIHNCDEEEGSFYLFKNKEYLGILYLKKFKEEPESYYDIEVKYIINCDSI